jgi:hypothetical protein
MPVHRGKNSKGPFYQWGGEGKKYHYTSGNKSSRDAPRRRPRSKARPPEPAVTGAESGSTRSQVTSHLAQRRPVASRSLDFSTALEP